MERIFNPRQFGALGDGITLDTKAIQAAIDEAGIAAERGAKTIVVLSKGIYLTSSLFLKSHMEFRMEEGAILLGTTDESQYPIMHTRVEKLLSALFLNVLVVLLLVLIVIL